MAVDYQQLVLPYVPPARCGDVPGTRRPVIVVGAGPVGLTLAIDIARYGTTVLLLEGWNCRRDKNGHLIARRT